MSGSYYALNSKINNLQAEIVALQAGGVLPPAVNIVTTNTAQTITGLKTFSTLPVSSVVPTTGNQLVNKTYADSLSPPTPTLSAVLTAGNSATNSIALNNTGVGTNVISLLPNASASNPSITLTDGTTTNTIDKNGYTTRNSVQNLTHYLNFSDASTTGTGSIQKTAGITCNPSTNTVSATTFVGSLTGTASTATNANNVAIAEDNTASTFYPTFVSDNTGNLPLKVDKTTTPLSYVPSTGTLTASNFSGIASSATTATNANNVAITDDNTSATFYPVFVSNNTGNLPLKVDKTTTPLSYVPSTGTLTASALVSGTLTASGLITANGGLTMGGSNNITLGTGAVAPTLGQLGYTLTPPFIATGNFTSGVNKIYGSQTIGTGTYVITASALFDTTTANTVSGYYIFLRESTGSGVLAITEDKLSFTANNRVARNLSAVYYSGGTTTITSNVTINFTGGTIPVKDESYYLGITRIA